MKILKKIKICTFLLIIMSNAYSKEKLPGLESNGCGTEGIQGILVPNSTLFTNCSFLEACNKHDTCYGKCLEGGALFGKETCNDSIAKEAGRNSCDTNFFNNIIEDNDERAVCKFYAKIYRFAVVKFGKGNFNGREIEKIAKLSFDKGELEAERFYQRLSKIQGDSFSPQSLKFDSAKNLLILKQKGEELKINGNQLNRKVKKKLNKD